MSYFNDKDDDNNDNENDLGGGGSDNESIVSDNDSIVSDNDNDLVGGGDDDDDDDYEGGGGEDDEDDDIEDINQQDDQPNTNENENIMYNKVNQMNNDDSDDDDDEVYLTKFDKEINQNYLLNNHPECTIQNYDEIVALSKVVRDKNNIIIDELHKTIPYLTKYERARILGQRTKQINAGATTFVKVHENMIDGYLIAELELQQKRIPFIIRRPLPNGGSEFWCVKDLENIAF
jgi:DNA-directed RNA polymerases I, II, and III subunit RPABC2